MHCCVSANVVEDVINDIEQVISLKLIYMIFILTIV
jgi:hypothetical protein